MAFSGGVLNNYVSISVQSVLDKSAKRNKPNIETREDVFGLPWNCLRVLFELANKYHLCLYGKAFFVRTTWFAFCNLSKACDRISNKCKPKYEKRLSSHMYPAMNENGVTSVLHSYLRGGLAREVLEDVAGFSDARRM